MTAIANATGFFERVKQAAKQNGVDSVTYDNWVRPLRLLGMGSGWRPVIGVPNDGFLADIPERVRKALVAGFMVCDEYVDEVSFVSERPASR